MPTKMTKLKGPEGQAVAPEETIGERILNLAIAGYPANKLLPDPTKRGYKRYLCDALGIVTTETLRQWVEGISRPNKTMERQLAHRLNCPPEAFMFGIGPQYRDAIAADKSTTLSGAIEMLGDALALVPAEARQELADLLRQWAVYGGRDYYGTGIGELLSGAGIKVDTSPRIKFSAEAHQVATLMDQLQDGDFRAALLSAANDLLAREHDPGSQSAQAQDPALSSKKTLALPFSPTTAHRTTRSR